MARENRKKYYRKQQKQEAKQEAKIVVPIADAPHKKTWTPYIVFLILGFVLYANSLTNKYALDDAIVLTKNVFTQEGIKGLGGIFKYDTFTGFWMTSEPGKSADQIQKEKKLVAGGRYRPLSLATFAAEISVFGRTIHEKNENIEYKGNPFVSHFINLLLYILTACLLFKILETLFPLQRNQNWIFALPFIATLLFLAHPIHTEAIANIKGRDEIMTLLGSLGALWFSIIYCKNKKTYNLLLSGLCLFLGLLSKENSITFLAIIPITLLFFVTKNTKLIITTFLPLFLAALIFIIIRAAILGIVSTSDIDLEILNNPFAGATTADKYATIFYTLLLYIKLLIFPHPLTYDYYPWQIEIMKFSNPKAFIPLIIYITLGIIALWGLFKKRNIVTWSIWLFLAPLSVVSNLVFPVGTFMNERFVYISSIALCIILAWFLTMILPKIIKSIKVSNALTATILVVILSLYSVKTISRNAAWHEDLTLFATDVKTSSKSAKSNCSAGGKILEIEKSMKTDNQGVINIEQLEKTYKFYYPDAKKLPNFNDAIVAEEEYNKLHHELCSLSIFYLERSVKIHPNYADAWNLLGNAYYENDFNIAGALSCYAEVLRITPYHTIGLGNAALIANNTNVFMHENKTKSTPEELMQVCDKLLSIIPNFGEIIHLKGVLYGRWFNDLNNAMPCFIQCENLPNFNKDANFYKNIGVAYGKIGNYEKALHYFLIVLELDPNDPQTYTNLSTTYHLLGDYANAEKYSKKNTTE
jgi:hypothetical protein